MATHIEPSTRTGAPKPLSSPVRSARRPARPRSTANGVATATGSRQKVAALVILLLAVGAVFAYGRAAPTAGAAALSERKVVSQLMLLSQAQPRPLAVFEPIELAPDLTATARLEDEGDAHALLWVQLRNDAGMPINGAALQAVVRMGSMAHGRSESTGVSLGGGIYAVPLSFAMAGGWQIDLNVNAGGTSGTAHFAVDTFLAGP